MSTQINLHTDDLFNNYLNNNGKQNKPALAQAIEWIRQPFNKNKKKQLTAKLQSPSKLGKWVNKFYLNFLAKTSSLLEYSWGAHANCYAYAMNCSEPLNGDRGGAKPGCSQGLVVYPTPDPKAYQKALIEGAQLDGAIYIENCPLISPPEPKPGYYLVALLCNASGFHWLRRNEETLAWSWKDGNGGTVKETIYEAKQMTYVSITDKTDDCLSALVNNKKTYVDWLYQTMRFAGFFRIPNSGCKVAGMT